MQRKTGRLDEGKDISHWSADGGGAGSSFAASGLFLIGTHQAMVEQFQGDMVELRVYDTQLSLTEIEAVEGEIAAAYIPEPSTIVLLLLGFLGISRARRAT